MPGVTSLDGIRSPKLSGGGLSLSDVSRVDFDNAGTLGTETLCNARVWQRRRKAVVFDASCMREKKPLIEFLLGALALIAIPERSGSRVVLS